MRAVDVDCPKCGTPAGTFCNGLGVGVDLCRDRITTAAAKTRASKRKTKCQRPRPCACDTCTRKTAIEHIEGDHRCGRDWSCQCAACRITRKEDPIIEIGVRFDRIKSLEVRRAAIKAIKAL